MANYYAEILSKLFTKRGECDIMNGYKLLGEACDVSDNIDTNTYKYLGKINSPSDLKSYDESEMPVLCDEIRDYLIKRVSENGGHLASNLGAVELSVAIHRNFNCPHDHIIFDVGHQSYIHKLLTGRYNRFDTLRQSGGLSGFTKRCESEYDCFGAGHSSTSLSAGLGFAEADMLSGSDAYTVVVLGDGAFTGGMVHEALNNCKKGLKLIIILNENEMSISKNIGRFARSMAKLRRKTGYFNAKRFTGKVVRRIPLLGRPLFSIMRRTKKYIKNALYGSNYFEDLGLYYLGPADGNNYADIDALIKEAKKAEESVIIHVKTKKGKGYIPAETSPGAYHGVRPARAEESETSFSQEFGKIICDMGHNDERICAITAAMSSGTGLDGFSVAYPDRFFDVGIAEEHAVTFAAGLSANGYKPICAIYSTFLQRSYDQIIHDAALQKLPMVIAIDRAGLNAADGATHHGIFDVAFLSHIPGVEIYTPVTYEGLSVSLKQAMESDNVSAVRYPSGSQQQILVDTFYKNGDFDKITVRTDVDGQADLLYITHGRIASECLKAKEILDSDGVSSKVALCEYISPYDKLATEVLKIIKETSPKAIVFVEEEIRAGGFGMMLAENLRTLGGLDSVKYHIAASDDFVIQTQNEHIYKSAKIDAESLVLFAENLMK